MSRVITKYSSEQVISLLDQLAVKELPVTKYKDVMHEVGRQIGLTMATLIGEQSVYLVCTTEDADFLARGVLESLDSGARNLRLACYWNDREAIFKQEGFSLKVAPPFRKYEEPYNDAKVLVILKSIISSGCVVKYNILSIIEKVNPTKIIIAAPVMYSGADNELRSEFQENISSRFSFLTFAIDDERDSDENIFPGIGGNVYKRLGFTDQRDKNKFVPDIVRNRRQSFA